jgi:hypothetical protein
MLYLFVMEEEDVDAYHASQAAYGSDEHHKYLIDNGYKMDPELSNYNTRTYTGKGKAIVVYRGTKPTSLVDLQADKAILTGTYNYTPQFMLAKDLARRAKKKYGNIVFTGHSLGGTKAIEAANATGGRAVVFNPGTGIFPLRTGKHKVYRKSEDIISQRVRGSNVHVSRGGHSLSEYEQMFRPAKRMKINR